jgi:signal transduction histidine kinase
MEDLMTLASQPRGPTTSSQASIHREGPDSRENGRSALAEAGLVHDLGNLIQVAASAISVVARHPEMPRTQAEPMLERARTCLDRAGMLVRRNIGLVRGRSIAGSENADVAACIDDVATLVEALAERRITLELAVEPNLPPVRCDPMGLQNAVLNLVFNARDAMPGGGCIAISAAVSTNAAGAEVEIHVADTGVGMSRATMTRAFEPFFTTKGDGLGGVGLPMVSRFVREAGGHVSIESVLGQGTRVILRLPAFDRPALPRS